MIPELVDKEVTLRKFQREVDVWSNNPATRERGWILLDRNDEQPAVEIGFLAKLSVNAGGGILPAFVCAVRLTYENYDLWPPSLTFIDPYTRAPSLPVTRALTPVADGFRDLVINGHPTTGQPFLCIEGVREYHEHPQHSGDDWLLHRAMKKGSPWNICEKIWHLMVRNILGLRVELQMLPLTPLRAQIVVQVAQCNIEALPPNLQPTRDQA